MNTTIEALKKLGDIQVWSKYTIASRYPFADQSDILSKIEETPDNCLYQYIHWIYRENLILLEVNAARGISKVIFNAELANSEFAMSFLVLTNAWPLYTMTIETILDNLVSWIDTYYKESLPTTMENQSKAITFIDIGLGIKSNEVWL